MRLIIGFALSDEDLEKILRLLKDFHSQSQSGTMMHLSIEGAVRSKEEMVALLERCGIKPHVLVDVEKMLPMHWMKESVH